MDLKTIELTAEITAAYVSNNKVGADSLAELIKGVFSALTATAGPPPAAAAAVLAPAVPIRRSVQPDYIVCLEDGKRYKSLKRHLQTKYGLTPAAYREKWGLPTDYPIVAPNYAASRSALAKAIGLGAKGRDRTAETPAAKVATPKAAPSRKAPAKPKSVKVEAKSKRSPKAIDPATDELI